MLVVFFVLCYLKNVGAEHLSYSMLIFYILFNSYWYLCLEIIHIFHIKHISSRGLTVNF